MARMPETNTERQFVLQPGYRVAMVLRAGVAPSRCHTGQITDVDEHGILMTLTHWAVDQTPGWDFYAPWSSITAALVSRSEQDADSFGQAAAVFQERCGHLP